MKVDIKMKYMSYHHFKNRFYILNVLPYIKCITQ